MARLFMDGWEYGKPNIIDSPVGDYYDSLWQVNAPGAGGTNRIYISANSSITNLSGDYSLRINKNTENGSTQLVYRQLPSTYNKLFARFYFYSVQNYNNVHEFFALHTSNALSSQSCQLKYNRSTGDFYLYVAGSLVTTVTGVILNEVWHLIEIMYDSSGSNIIVKVDNQQIINYSGSINSAINHVFLGNQVYTSFSTPQLYQYYDDFAINDDSGSINNTWIGAGVIRLLKPTSDDTNSDFTPNTGVDNYANVDDFPDDGDTTYNSSTVSGDIDTFGLESVPSIATGQTINAVQAIYRARSETDVASVAPILVSGATTDTGATQSTILSDYNKTNYEIYDVDPNTSAQWTETNVNAVKGGYKNAT